VDNTYGHLPPQAIDLEKVVLGALMIDKDAFAVVSELLHPETFYEPRHQKIYTAIRSLNMDEKPVDIMTVTEQLKRAGTIDGKPITENDQYRALRNCTPADMSALLNTAPAALLFGAWDSTRKSNQVRLRSALVGEIIGVLADQEPGAEHRQARRGGARVDAVAASVQLTPKDMESLVNDQEAELSAKNVAARRKEAKIAKADARISASTLGLGSIPPVLEETGAVACRRIIRSWVLSLATLRQLRFGQDEEKNIAARALLAALGLNAIARAERELYIRANCDLIESAAPVVTLDQRFGRKKEFAPLTVEHTDQLLLEAIEKAKEVGVAEWDGQTFNVEGNSAIIANATAEDAE